MSEFDQDPSASTGRFRAFVERGDEDFSRPWRSPVSPAVLIAVGAAVIAIVIVIVAMA
ncbi:MAG: hypothetical protein JO037_11115 [Actinobacteria bacterium]|nr:hypothetical protein [Actinomycetota bacterium]